MTQEQVQTSYLPAALSMPSKAFTYRFFLSACFLILVLGSVALQHSALGVFILALMDILFCADILFRCALKDLFSKHFSLSGLVSLCALCGFIYSALNSFHVLAWHGPVTELYVYTMLLVTLALWVERRLSREKEKTRVFIKKLDDFLPKAARLCVGRQFRKVFAKELKPGDLVLVKNGERLPCDGIIRKGKTSIDEQLITGNMMPTAKRLDNRVYAGTLNKSDHIYVEVTQTLPSSAIMGIISAIKNSERHRITSRSLLDGYAAWVLPIITCCALCLYVVLLVRHGFSQWANYLGVFLFVTALFCPAALAFAVIFPSFFARSGAKRVKLKIQNLNSLDKIVAEDT
ncbi:MAG: cation-translocating P-type ATPase, partial [Elusimicrobiaceae bacterium]|nr:cation-translocating P-type ATPase [Elusimicrobiaceae bacterium]